MRYFKYNIFAASILMLALGFITSCQPKAEDAAATPDNAAKERVPVRTAVLAQREFRELLQIAGTLEAKEKAAVSTRVSGTIAKIFFDEGDSVKAGDILFQLDDRSYRDSVAVAEATVAAQESAVQVAAASVTKSQAQLQQAQLDAQRYQRLFQSGNASSSENEKYQLALSQAQADVEYAKAYLESQKSQVALAKANLAIRKKDLEDTVIRAPISGVISQRLHDPGEEVGDRVQVFAITGVERLRMAAALPAEYYSRVIPGTTKIRLTVDGKDYPKELTVTAKNPSIETGLRTFEIKAEFTNDQKEMPLVPGALANASIELRRCTGFGVALDVPIKRASGTLLFTLQPGENSTAKALTVTTGIEENGWIQVQGDALQEGMTYVIDGQFQITEGTPVRVIQ